MYVSLMPAATVQSELPLLDLGNESRVIDDGKFLENGYRMLSETENPSFLPISNDSMRIFVGDLIKKSGMIYYYNVFLDYTSGNPLLWCFKGILPFGVCSIPDRS